MRRASPPTKFSLFLLVAGILPALCHCSQAPLRAMALSPRGHGGTPNQLTTPSWQAWAYAPAPVVCRGSSDGVRCRAQKPDPFADHLLAAAEAQAIDNGVLSP